MAEKKKTLKTYKTAAGAQQYGDDKAWRKLSERLIKDIENLDRAEFKKKYGIGKLEAQSRIFAGNAAAYDKKAKDEKRPSSLIGSEKYWDSDKKTMRKLDNAGMAKYNKGGYANCGASVKATQKATMACGGMAHKKK